MARSKQPQKKRKPNNPSILDMHHQEPLEPPKRPEPLFLPSSLDSLPPLGDTQPCTEASTQGTQADQGLQGTAGAPKQVGRIFAQERLAGSGGVVQGRPPPGGRPQQEKGNDKGKGKGKAQHQGGNQATGEGRGRERGMEQLKARGEGKRTGRMAQNPLIEYDRFSPRGRYVEQVIENGSEPVGWLEGVHQGRSKRVAVRFRGSYTFGRDPTCNYRFNLKEVSRFHFKTHAIRTTGSLSLAVIEDTSVNGVFVNGVRRDPTRTIGIAGHRVGGRFFVLMDKDEIRIPGTDVTWTYRHNKIHHGQSPSTQDGTDDPPSPLFDTSDPSKTISVGGYHIRNVVLGTGSYSTVYFATRSLSQVAIKTVNPVAYQQFQSKNSRIGEKEAMELIKHPNVQALLDTFDVRWEDGKILEVCVLPLVTGGDVFSYSERFGALKEREVKFFAYQLLQGLKVLHDKGIAHRDIKPENVLVYTMSTFPRLIIADLGDAANVQSMIHVVPTRTGPIQRGSEPLGTPRYMPPEALARQSDMWILDGSTACRKKVAREWIARDMLMDVWALGCITYSCMTGCHPYAFLDPSVVPPEAEAEADEELVFDSAEMSQTMETNDGNVDMELDNLKSLADVAGSEMPMPTSSTAVEPELESDEDDDLADLASDPGGRGTMAEDENELDLKSNQAHQAEKTAIATDPKGIAAGPAQQEDGDTINQDRQRLKGSSAACKPEPAVKPRYKHDPRATIPSTFPLEESDEAEGEALVLWAHEVAVAQMEEEELVHADEEYRDMLARVRSFIAQDPNNWLPSDIWHSASPESISFIQAAMAFDPNDRASVNELLGSSWIQDGIDELRRLYEKVVVQGKDWRAR